MKLLANFIYHTNTSNKSFLKMYKILKNLGIKNNKFFLRLYDKDLLNIDPFDEDNLSINMKAKIQNECTRNFWYFIRECVKIPVPGGMKRYEIHRGNLALNYLVLNNINTMEVLPRQHYKTISTIVLFEYFYNISTTMSNIVFMNKEFSDSKLNLERFKNIEECLPSYLIPKDSKNDIDNIEYIKSGITGNTIKALSAAHSEPEADKKGRGMTTPLQWWDEFAFLKYNNIIYGSSVPAASQAMKEAEMNGKNHSIIITTTPNNIDIPQGRYCYNMIQNACRFDEKMYDWKIDFLKEYIENNSQNTFVYIEFSYEQLGKDKKWFDQQCKILNNDRLLIKREILLEWTKSSDNSLFDEETLDAIYAKIREPIGSIMVRKFYKVEFYQAYSPDKCYIISCDVSGGESLDKSTIIISDPITNIPIGSFESSKIDTDEFRNVIYELMKVYLPASVLVVERNSYGKNILDTLMKTDISNRIYWEHVEKLAEKRDEGLAGVIHPVKKEKVKTMVYGVNTDNNSRPKMMELLLWIASNEPECLAIKPIYDELKTLIRNKRGKIEHDEGQHDDCIMGYLLFRYVMAYGRNIKKFINVKLGSSTAEVTKYRVNKMYQINRYNTSDNYENMSNNSFTKSLIESGMFDNPQMIYNAEMQNENISQSNRQRVLKNIFALNNNETNF